MATQRLMTAFIVFMVTIVALYVFDLTMGGVLDALHYNFSILLPQLDLPPQWNNIAINILGYWSYIWRSITVIIIAVGLWVLRTAFLDVDYTRPM